MSKYTEAIPDVVDIICESNTTKPTMVVFEQEKQSLWTAVEALQIADRLEQADVKRHEPYIRDMATFEGTEAIGYVTMWFKLGYETALADIRGDNNGD